MEAICNHQPYRYLCKECYKLLCDKCKLNHNHTNVIENSFLNSFVKFEVENLKIMLNELEIFQIFDEQVSLKNFIYKLREVESQLVEEKLNLNGLVKGQNISIRDVIFNAKVLINEEANLTSKEEIAYVDFYKKLQETTRTCTTLNAIIEKINKSFDNFNAIIQNYDKYKDIQRIKNEQNLIKNHTDLIENITKDKYSELNEKIKLLESENQKIVDLNKKLNEEIKELTAINNKFYIVEGKKIESQKYDPKNQKKYFDYYKSDLDSILDKLKAKVLSTSIQQNQFEEIDKIELKSLIKMSLESLLASMNLEEFKFLYYDPPNFKNFLINIKFLDDITEGPVYKKSIETIKVILANEIVDSIYENREAIFKQLQISLYSHYLKNSKKVKQLKAFDFKNYQIEDKDMLKISEILNCSKVTEVFLQNNLITDAGALQFFENIRENKIKTIYFNNNSLTEKTIKGLLNLMNTKSKIFGNLKIISFENNKIRESEIKETLREIKKFLKITIYI